MKVFKQIAGFLNVIVFATIAMTGCARNREPETIDVAARLAQARAERQALQSSYDGDQQSVVPATQAVRRSYIKQENKLKPQVNPWG